VGMLAAAGTLLKLPAVYALISFEEYLCWATAVVGRALACSAQNPSTPWRATHPQLDYQIVARDCLAGGWFVAAVH
jgi:hypothetical protein